MAKIAAGHIAHHFLWSILFFFYLVINIVLRVRRVAAPRLPSTIYKSCSTLLLSHLFGYCSSAHEQCHIKIATWTIFGTVPYENCYTDNLWENLHHPSTLFCSKHTSSRPSSKKYSYSTNIACDTIIFYLRKYYSLLLRYLYKNILTIHLEKYICFTVCRLKNIFTYNHLEIFVRTTIFFHRITITLHGAGKTIIHI
jgi:hypothetical protein